jgi:hypothetical protein
MKEILSKAKIVHAESNAEPNALCSIRVVSLRRDSQVFVGGISRSIHMD